MNKPLVSVVIPVHNGMPFICETLDSIAGQNYPNLEIIVSENHSTDNTLNAIESWISSNPSQKVIIKKPPKFLPIAENWLFALSCAKGKFVKLLMADDILYQDSITRQTNELLQNEEASFTAGARLVVSGSGKPRFIQKSFTKSQIISKKNAIFILNSRLANFIGEPSSALIRLSSLKKINPATIVKMDYLVDFALWLELLEAGTLIYTVHPIVKFRIHRRANTTSLQKKACSDFSKLRTIKHEFFPQPKIKFLLQLYLQVAFDVFLRNLVYKLLA